MMWRSEEKQRKREKGKKGTEIRDDPSSLLEGEEEKKGGKNQLVSALHTLKA